MAKKNKDTAAPPSNRWSPERKEIDSLPDNVRIPILAYLSPLGAVLDTDHGWQEVTIKDVAKAIRLHYENDGCDDKRIIKWGIRAIYTAKIAGYTTFRCSAGGRWIECPYPEEVPVTIAKTKKSEITIRLYECPNGQWLYGYKLEAKDTGSYSGAFMHYDHLYESRQDAMIWALDRIERWMKINYDILEKSVIDAYDATRMANGLPPVKRWKDPVKQEPEPETVIATKTGQLCLF
jgi:hypothetical protein